MKHLIITNITGNFKSFGAALESNHDDFNDADISFWADAKSVDTDSEQRDVHLAGSEFFDIEKFPKIEFKGESIENVGEDYWKLKGLFTIRGVAKPITLDAEGGTLAKDPWRNIKT